MVIRDEARMRSKVIGYYFTSISPLVVKAKIES